MTTKSEARLGTVGIIFGLFAILALCIGLLLFVVEARQTAKEGQRLASEAVASEERLRTLITERCRQRESYDKRFLRAAEGDAKFYSDLLAASDQALKEFPLTPAERIFAEKQRQIIREARDRKLSVVREGVVGNCDSYETVSFETPAQS